MKSQNEQPVKQRQRVQINRGNTIDRQHTSKPGAMVNPSFLDGGSIFPMLKRLGFSDAQRGPLPAFLASLSLALSSLSGLVSTSSFQDSLLRVSMGTRYLSPNTAKWWR
jgi:hypothetical protein